MYSENVHYESFPQIHGSIHIKNLGKISLGKKIIINSGREYNPIQGANACNFWTNKGAEIIIKNNAQISNTVLYCFDKIEIGENVFIGGGCEIYDTDFHSLKAEDRLLASKDPKIKSKAVKIEKNVFLGAHTTVLKGVTIGENSVIGAGSVVTKDIPANEIWAGNPAKFIRKL